MGHTTTKDTLRELVQENYCSISFIRANTVYYTITDTHDIVWQFPVPLEDIQNATLSFREKAIMLMRYIRRAMQDGTFIFHSQYIMQDRLDKLIPDGSKPV